MFISYHTHSVCLSLCHLCTMHVSHTTPVHAWTCSVFSLSLSQIMSRIYLSSPIATVVLVPVKESVSIVESPVKINILLLKNPYKQGKSFKTKQSRPFASASTDNLYLNLDYSGYMYHKNLFQ